MQMWPRLAAMLVAMILTAAAVVVLKGMLPGHAATPAQISGNPDAAAEDSRNQVAQQPTILQAKPAIQDGWAGPRGNYPERISSAESPVRELDRELERDEPHSPTPLPNPRPLEPQAPSLDDPRWQHGQRTRPETTVIRAPGFPLPEVPPPKVPPPGEGSQARSDNVPTKPVFLTRVDDSLWDISEQLYGSGAFYMALYLHNRAKIPDPARLAPNLALETPPEAELRRLYPEHCPAK